MDHEHEDKPAKVIEIEVNGREVKISGKNATGLQIKEAAIAQGGSIQLNFVLQQELPNGSSAIIGDADIVHLHPHLRFTAIAPDDNS
ncbi:MAG: multiubiquitin domain-containing protein [Aestuariivirga sp.]